MNLLAPYLTLEAVRLDVEALSRKRLFEEAALAVEAAYGEPHDEVFNALMARERLGSTGIGFGCAVPHGRLPELESPAVALVRSKAPIPYDAPDGLPVQLFMTILVPEEHPENHLALLRETARLFQDEAMRRALLEAPDAVGVCSLIADWTPPAEEGESGASEGGAADAAKPDESSEAAEPAQDAAR